MRSQVFMLLCRHQFRNRWRNQQANENVSHVECCWLLSTDSKHIRRVCVHNEFTSRFISNNVEDKQFDLKYELYVESSAGIFPNDLFL